MLEAHTLTSLLPQIEHAILIGDHQQLRPQIQTYELQHVNPTGEKYSLDVSLFERLVEPQGDRGFRLPVTMLKIQRRMHPWIAQLIRDTLYPTLQDHPSVQKYPEVCGLGKRLYWLDHGEVEAAENATGILSTSHSNDFEVEMTAALVSHLIRQGNYRGQDIAVLTPYLGQLLKLQQRLSTSHELIIGDRDTEDLKKEGLDDGSGGSSGVLLGSSSTQKTTLAMALRIATVDNFQVCGAPLTSLTVSMCSIGLQGEEAKVVVISLVRSNAGNKCGFLKTSNRINVLLRYVHGSHPVFAYGANEDKSRAQHGMYIIGNAETSRHVPMWAKVLSIFEARNNIGPSLPLRCPRHPSSTIEVSTPDDFLRLAPEGGCSKRCDRRLHCGHACLNKCHSDHLHYAVICLEPCQRSMNGCDHSCPRLCGQECEQRCHVKIPNVSLLCGHVQKSLNCWQAQDLAQVRCKKLVSRTVPGCQHTVSVHCHVDVELDSFKCEAECGELLPCGHACLRRCGVCNTRRDGQIVQRSHDACRSPCNRLYNTCSHRCRLPCHGEEPCRLCKDPCDVRCVHSVCSRKCHEPCAPCAQACSWSCPHRGRCQMPCAVPCDILPCSERCPEQLACGHACPSICGEKCPSPRFCQTCAPEDVKAMTADFIMQDAFVNVDLDQDPIIVPSCGHLMTLSSMDGHMVMSKYYELSEEGSPSVKALRALPEAFSEENLKTCPVCRGSLRNINRYNRIVRQGLIEAATKKFITWANREYLPLEQDLFDEEKRLQRTTTQVHRFSAPFDAMGGGINNNNDNNNDNKHMPAAFIVDQTTNKLSSSALIEGFSNFRDLEARYRPARTLRGKILEFLKRVSEAEQPFGRVFDMVQDIRRRRGITSRSMMNLDRSVLNTRNRMLATVLRIRCDLAIINDFFVLRRNSMESGNLRTWSQAPELSDNMADFRRDRQACQDVVYEAEARNQPMHQVEARLFWARWFILERSVSRRASGVVEGESEDLSARIKDHLVRAEQTCRQYPGQTRGMLQEAEEVKRMMRYATFYTVVEAAEKRQVYAAMAGEFQGTGHWYTCVNGHPFTVAQCGLPVETAHCPQCGQVIGAFNHRPAEGSRPAREFDEEFGAMAL